MSHFWRNRSKASAEGGPAIFALAREECMAGNVEAASRAMENIGDAGLKRVARAYISVASSKETGQSLGPLLKTGTLNDPEPAMVESYVPLDLVRIQIARGDLTGAKLSADWLHSVRLARHGPMVLNVCHRVLHDRDAAADAFQATFLVLIRKAPSIRRGELLANWLYGVAYRTARRAKVESAKRHARESAAALKQPADCLADITVRELFAAIDGELDRLSSQYRAPLVLCYLEGKTRDEAAQQLGWSLSTLDRRLNRARDMLRTKLIRHGVTLSVALCPVLLLQSSASACVSSSLVVSTIKAASAFAAGQALTGGIISANVAALAEGVLKTMFLTKLKIATAVLLTLGLLGVGVGTGSQAYWGQGGVRADEPAHHTQATPANDEPDMHEVARQPSQPPTPKEVKENPKEVPAKPWYAMLKPPTPEEVERYFNDLREKNIARQFAAQPGEGKWPDFQPGPDGKDRWEQARGGLRTVGPWGQEIVIDFPGKWPAPIVPLKSYPPPTGWPMAAPPAPKKAASQELKNEVEVLRERIRQLEKRLAEPPKVPTAYFKVEVRGTLRVTDKVEVVSATLAQELAKQPANATITGWGMYLAFGDNKELAALVTKLDGKAVLITGELRRAYEGPISGLFPPRFDDYIKVTALKAAE